MTLDFRRNFLGKKGNMVYPFPETLPEGEDYTINEVGPGGASRVDVINKILEVPLGEDEQDYYMRLHELGHIALPPGNHSKRVEKMVANVVEDARIDMFLKGNDQQIDAEEGALKRACCNPKNSFKGITLAAVASLGLKTSFIETGDFAYNVYHERSKKIEQQEPDLGKRRRAIEEWHRDYSGICEAGDTVKSILNDYEYSQEGAKKASSWLQTFLNKKEAENEKKKKEEERGRASSLEKALSKKREDHEEKLGLYNSRIDEDMVSKIKTSPTFANTATKEWGTMSIDTPPRPNRFEAALNIRKNRPSDRGNGVKYMRNFTSSGRVFGRKKPRPGVSIVIDASGSMSLSQEQIMGILEDAPASVIGIYSGCAEEGVLRVLVKKGRMVEKRHVNAPGGGGNVVDGPALDWLAKQPKPRIWISDGGVTGHYDFSGATLVADVVNKCRVHDITRIDTLGETRKIIKDALGGKTKKDTAASLAAKVLR